MDEIIIIRALDSDGSSFKKIIDALHENNIRMAEMISPVLSFGEIEIYPASRRVLRAGSEIRLNTIIQTFTDMHMSFRSLKS